MHDLIIIGGGPAGSAAAVYAARKQLKTLHITNDWGGQSIVSPDIQNWIGTPSIAGAELAKTLKTHAETYAGEWVDFVTGTVSKLEKNTQAEAESWVVTASDQNYIARSVLVATGSKRRHLPAERADELEHKGLTYCATCDGPLFAGQDVAVVGGGNAAFETAAQLLAYTKSVTLFNRSEDFKADPVTVSKVLSHPNMTAIHNTEITTVVGDKFVSGLKYRQDNEEKDIAVTGIFVEIGMIPNTDYVTNVLDTDDYGRIIIDPWTQQTSAPGVWAAGDCTNVRYHQNNISAGDAVKALEDIYVHLRAK